MSHELKEGVKVLAISGLPHQEGNLFCKVGKPGEAYWSVADIVIAEQPGDMAMIPFAKVTYHDGRTSFHNIHNLEAIELPAPGGEQ